MRRVTTAKVDGDSDWDLSNNRTWITSGATQLLPAVYYSVSETYTHWYITYVYYFAYVNHPDAAFFTGNGSAGVLVVVEKARGEQADARTEQVVGQNALAVSA